MKCPLCGCETFYVKDPEDEYETYYFTCSDEGVKTFEENHPYPPELDTDTTVYCENCAWKGGLGQLGKNG